MSMTNVCIYIVHVVSSSMKTAVLISGLFVFFNLIYKRSGAYLSCEVWSIFKLSCQLLFLVKATNLVTFVELLETFLLFFNTSE